jgi:tetratricopeptide (TPR) repeat protein
MHHYYMAQSYVASVSHSRALKELEQAVRLDPTNPKFYVLQTKIFLDQDKSSEGAKTALAAMERSRDTISDILGLSDEFYLPEAKVVYAKAIELGSREVLPYLGLGNIALHSGDLAEAEKWFKRARELQPDHPAVLLAWGRLASAKGNREKDKETATNLFQEARELLEKSKAKGEESATLYAESGEVYGKARRVGQGQRLLRRSPANETEKKRLAPLSGRSLCEAGQGQPSRTEISRGFGAERRRRTGLLRASSFG